MENTCKQDCDRYKHREKKCPNFTYTTWVNDRDEHKTVEDCAPIRTMLMVQDLYQRLTGIQSAVEQSRNFKIEIGANLTERLNGLITKQLKDSD